jgi:suppressor for copper-sensitivity B
MNPIFRSKTIVARLAIWLFTVVSGLHSMTGSVHAAVSPWVDQEHVRLRLVAGSTVAEGGESLNLGLHFQLRPGWKIYWRSPGEAGYPPSVDWSGSQNLTEVSIDWPVPHRFSLFGIETFGYSDEVVLPIDARAERPGETIQLRANVDYLTCKEVCIPQQAELSLDLPEGTSTPSTNSFLIDSYRTLVPGDGSTVGLSLDRVVLTGSMAESVLQVTARSDIAFDAPDVLVEAPPGFLFGKPKVNLTPDGKTAVLRLATVAATDESVLEGKRLTLTVIDGTRGMEQSVIARFAKPAITEGAAAKSLVVILGLALLGGLILNLMPCVLPVLSIKLLLVVRHGGSAPGAVRASFLASAAGIVTSFLALAGIVVTLKELGVAVGWGIQFQQPLFLTAMAVVVSVFACNLFGFFEISLPTWAQGRFGGSTRNSGAEPSLAGHFAIGALTTMLATPCSAPFVGTAVGFALARQPGDILLIFAALGIGLALPYLAVVAWPKLAICLPHPGSWMVTLRRALGLALVGTAVWLLSVLAAQVGLSTALGVGGLLLALGYVLWLGHSNSETRALVSALATGLALAAFTLPAALPNNGQDGAAREFGANDADTSWHPLELDLIPALVAEGKVVFVDLTADWCITCQVNKILVLDQKDVRALFESGQVIPMRGDWTLPSEEISRYLESFGRYGIPFDVAYGPGLPDGMALPELLTVDAVMESLERAKLRYMSNPQESGR